MGHDGTDFATIVETTSFLHYFKDLPDHRQAGKVDYPLPEVLLLILLAVLAGDAVDDLAPFGQHGKSKVIVQVGALMDDFHFFPDLAVLDGVLVV